MSVRRNVAISMVGLVMATTSVEALHQPTTAHADVLTFFGIHESKQTKQALQRFTQQEQVVSKAVKQKMQEQGIINAFRRAKAKGYRYARKVLTKLEQQAKLHHYPKLANVFAKLERQLAMMR